MIFKFILRDLKNNYKFSLLFVLNLSLGLIGFIALDTFKTSLKSALDTNAKNFLSADLSLSARRALTDQEIKIAEESIEVKFSKTRLWEFFSMVNSEQGSKLVQIKAIETEYPFYGSMKLGSGRKIIQESNKEIISEDKVWVYPELLLQLKLKIGDKIKLGDHFYTIADTVTDDSTQTFRLSSLAPKVYVGREQIQKSNLVQKGTTYTDAILFKIVAEENKQNTSYSATNIMVPDVKEIAKRIFSKISDPGVQVTTAEEAGQDTARALGYLNDYLGLVSLVALFLSALGAAYLFRHYFASQLKSLAIYNILGLSFSKARINLVMQILILSIISALVSSAVAISILPLLKNLLMEFSPIDVSMKISFRIFLVAFALCTLGSLSMSALYLIRISRLKINQLFQEEGQFTQLVEVRDYLIFIFPLSVFWLLSVWQANSIKIGSLFVALLSLSLFFIILSFIFLLKLISVFKNNKNWILKFVTLQLNRKKTKTLACALALSLGTILINILPQVRASIRQDLQSPESSALPALFLFDIQEDQVQELLSDLANLGYQQIAPSPMVRARILQVNGQNFEKISEQSSLQTREEETEARFRNRGFNLSYRDQLSPTESLVEGKLWTQPYSFDSNRLPQISVEKRFAERLKFKLGDVLKFDIQGVEIEGQISSLRTVRWNSFQPNFFVLFQPGAIEDAPKTFLLSLPKSKNIGIVELQNSIAEKFPNISIVDVGRTVEKVLGLLESMSWSLEFMALLCLIVGFIVLYTIISNQVELSKWDLNLLKILGATSGKTLLTLSIEFSLIGFFSSLIGVCISFLASFVLAQYLFQSEVVVDFKTPFLSVILITFLSWMIAMVTAFRVSRQKAQFILQS